MARTFTDLAVVLSSDEDVWIFGVVLEADQRRDRLQRELRLVWIFYKIILIIATRFKRFGDIS